MPSPVSLVVLPALYPSTNNKKDKSGKGRHAAGEEREGKVNELWGETRSQLEGNDEKMVGKVVLNLESMRK